MERIIAADALESGNERAAPAVRPQRLEPIARKSTVQDVNGAANDSSTSKRFVEEPVFVKTSKTVNTISQPGTPKSIRGISGAAIGPVTPLLSDHEGHLLQENYARRVQQALQSPVRKKRISQGTSASSLHQRNLQLDSANEKNVKVTVPESPVQRVSTVEKTEDAEALLSPIARIRRGTSHAADVFSAADEENLAQVSVHVASWNMNHVKTMTEPFAGFLCPNGQPPACDLYVIGVQECAMEREKWRDMVADVLGDNYKQVHVQELVAIKMCIFAHQTVWKHISKIESADIPTKLGGALKTKGAVGMSFTIAETSFLFINTHMTPHQHKVADRNEDYRTITQGLPLPHQNHLQQVWRKSMTATRRVGTATHWGRGVWKHIRMCVSWHGWVVSATRAFKRGAHVRFALC
eukprot:m.515173 g.515173  ORF g.515173 m.515173 type:complete len:409 (-) comp21919_c0_seq8:1284-2510(-)